MKIKTGDKAPGFILKDTEKKDVDLTTFRGKNVILLFFPLAFTGVCTKELCDVRDDKKKYEELNAEVLAISVDSIFSLQRFKADQSYNFTLLSDFNKEVSRSYGSLYEDFIGMKGVSKRSAFVIDKTGVIRYAEVLDNAGEIPNFERINDTLQSIS